MGSRPDAAPRIASMLVVADDLIWSSRLLSFAAHAGTDAWWSVGDLAGLNAVLATGRPTLVVVDLGARSFDGVEAIAAASAAGSVVIAIGPHEDHALRRRALDAGARRVYANSKMHRDGVALMREWLTARAGQGG